MLGGLGCGILGCPSLISVPVSCGRIQPTHKRQVTGKLSKDNGYPVIEPLAGFQDNPAYRVFIGAKRVIPVPQVQHQ